MELLVLRHLPTRSNIDRIYMGQLDEVIFDQDVQVDFGELVLKSSITIYYSTLMRCRQTVIKLLDQLIKRSDNEASLSLIPSRSLIERDLGDFSGRIKEEIIQEYASKFIGGGFDPYFTPPHGETLDSLFERVTAFYSQIKQLNDNTQLLICSHVHVLRALYCIHHQVEPRQIWHKLKIPHGIVKSLDSIA